MTGKEKIDAAFSTDGARETPAVICYEGIYIRDHWEQLTACPWWYKDVPDLEKQIEWRSQVIRNIGQDWFNLPFFYQRTYRGDISIEVRPNGVFEINKSAKEEREIEKPRVSGWADPSRGTQSFHPADPPETPEELDAAIPLPDASDIARFAEDGRCDLAAVLLKEFGRNLCPAVHVTSPLCNCYYLWGFEGMMTLTATRPDLVEYACRRFLAQSAHRAREAAILGAECVWIEECLTDMISPEAFKKLNVPFLVELVEEIRAAGLKSIYYFCGNPAGKWDQILSVGADAISLEESKKGFSIDIDEVVDRARGRCAVLGNLDAIGILQNGTERQLRAEIARQLAAGRRNKGRFIMSLGSPVTPETPAERVRLYCDIVHDAAG